MTAVGRWPVRRGRTVELLLILGAVAIVTLAWCNVTEAIHGTLPADLWIGVAAILVLTVGCHLVLRWRVAYADPLILPIITLLNGLGIVMIYRLDLAHDRSFAHGLALRQIIWTAISVVIAVAVLLLVRDHRVLRRYTFLSAAVGVLLLLLPLVPVIGRSVNGSRIWVGLGPFTLQPGEIAKVVLTIFFASYLVRTRDALTVAGKRVLGLTLPRARDLGPILAAWAVAVGILVLQSDLGTSLLFFGLFVAMLYVATERVSWIVIGMTLFGAAAYAAYVLIPHVRERVELWLHPFAYTRDPHMSDQVAKGLMGMASGGMFGTGLGLGRPDLTYFSESDYIFPSFAEEIGLVGVFALLVLYAVLTERGLRTALGVRDGFGKLLATGLAFIIALQVFVIVGGVTRVIPLTGLTTPFLSYGGSSLLANWSLAALLLRISDQARRPVPAVPPAPAGRDVTEEMSIR